MAATMEAAMFIMFNMHACVCAAACTYVTACAQVCNDESNPPPPTPTHPPIPQGGTPQISKSAI